MDIMTFETARRLQEAGFPEPETVELGQTWYSCRDINGIMIMGFWIITNWHRLGSMPFKFFGCYPTFAPSATDILREIPHLRLYFDGEEWVVCEFDRNKNEEIVIARHANAAEAAAKAYLFINLNEE